MTAPGRAIDIPDTTGATFSLLRELRRGRARKKAAGFAYGLYVAAMIVLVYGGNVVVGAVRALRHPPAAAAITPHVLGALPAGLTALALLALLALLRDALWRGPVTLRPAEADWLLGTPVDRGRLLRPRFWRSAVVAAVAGVAAGVVVTSGMVEAGLGGRDTGEVLRLGAVAAGCGALFALIATGAGGVVQRYPAARWWLRRISPVVVTVAVVLAGLAGWGALGRPPGIVTGVVLWSGPWGWVARPVADLAGAAGGAGAGGGAGGAGAGAGGAGGGVLAGAAGGPAWWVLAVALLAAGAAAALAAGRAAAPGVPAASLRVSSRAVSAMSASLLGMDTRGFALAYGKTIASGRRVWLRLPPPRRRWLALPWRDCLAVGRSPSRLAAAVVAELLGVGLFAVSWHGGHVPPVPAACGLALGYLAAAWLCEAARLDADDPRRSAHLPVGFPALTRWHAIVPGGVLLVAGGLPVTALAVMGGTAWPVALLTLTVPVLVTGALVNVYRGQLPPGGFGGFETAVGNTGGLFVIIAWIAAGPVLAVVPMTVLISVGARAPGPSALVATAVASIGLAWILGRFATRRARRLRTEARLPGRPRTCRRVRGSGRCA